MLKIFIKKPVLATVISIMLVILGSLALFKLPLQQFPDIAPPCVVVNATYPGANAETILRSVAPSLEEAINGVENMTYMSSTASNDGTLAISVFFKLGTNPDQAAVNVQNRVSQATAQLPPEVVQQGIVSAKQMNGIVMTTGIYSDDEKKYDQTFLSNYCSINIIPELKRITGVGSATVFGGSQDYSMRIWLKPAKMETYHLSPKEITDAIQDKSLESAPGRFGDRTDEAFEYVIKYKGKLNKPEDYENIAIRTNPDGSVLRLKEVARIEFGSFIYTTKQRINGHVGIAIPVVQLAGSNANQIQVEVNKFMEKLDKKLPAGIHTLTFYSTKRQLDASIEQVVHTLIEAFILVFIVVYLFLQDFRATLIPAIAVPVAIVGTFFFMYLFGFTINLLTLFALVLSIGIVVDDAIVVVEAVHAKMDTTGMRSRQATVSAMHDITGAIISITLVMAAVFLPVGFMEGSTGLFYRQFAFTMAIAIMISALNALTLSPALAALFLKNVHHNGETGKAEKPNFKTRFFNGFNGGFNGLTNRYLGFIKFLIARKWIAIGGLVVVVIASLWMIKTTPTGFIPTEDQRFFAVAVSLPAATSLKRTEEIMLQAEKKLHFEPGSYVMSFPGVNVMTQSASPSAGIIFVTLNESKEGGKVKEIAEIMAHAQQNLATVKGASFFLFTFPTVPGFGSVEALDVVIQDRSAGKLDKFSAVANNFITELNKLPSIGMAFTSFKADYPQYQIEVDDDKAGQLGVSVKDALQTVQSYFGTAQAGDFNRFGKYYRVVLQADSSDKRTPEALQRVYVKNNAGNMVPLSTVVKLTRVFGSETASRYNLFNSIQLNVIPKKGHSSGEAIEAIKTLAAKKLPADYSFEFSGQTREEIASGGQSAIIFIMSLVFVYFLLAAQYESYILPLAVICSIPTGVFGVFALIGLKGIENNIYVQVALIMLIGLLAKNAILIVEFAVQRRRAGLSLFTSALEAAKLRLRPIVMTSLAFIFGLFPLSIASGPSAQGNHSISYSAAGGMISGVVLGLLIIPVLFIIFQGLQERISGVPGEVEDDFDLEPLTKGKAEHASLS